MKSKAAVLKSWGIRPLPKVEWWTVFGWSGPGGIRICSRHKSNVKAVMEAIRCERRGGVEHVLLRVENHGRDDIEKVFSWELERARKKPDPKFAKMLAEMLPGKPSDLPTRWKVVKPGSSAPWTGPHDIEKVVSRSQKPAGAPKKVKAAPRRGK